MDIVDNYFVIIVDKYDNTTLNDMKTAFNAHYHHRTYGWHVHS